MASTAALLPYKQPSANPSHQLLNLTSSHRSWLLSSLIPLRSVLHTVVIVIFVNCVRVILNKYSNNAQRLHLTLPIYSLSIPQPIKCSWPDLQPSPWPSGPPLLFPFTSLHHTLLSLSNPTPISDLDSYYSQNLRGSLSHAQISPPKRGSS